VLADSPLLTVPVSRVVLTPVGRPTHLGIDCYEAEAYYCIDIWLRCWTDCCTMLINCCSSWLLPHGICMSCIHCWLIPNPYPVILTVMAFSLSICCMYSYFPQYNVFLSFTRSVEIYPSFSCFLCSPLPMFYW